MKKRYTAEDPAALVISGILSAFFMIKSPLHPWVGGDSGTDSSVFKTVALMMEKGYMPYRNTFDHKGPLLYIINYFGNAISPFRGIWLVEVLFIALTLFMIYKSARLVTGRAGSALTALLSFSLLFAYYDDGNLCEEYAMVFIAVSTWIFMDFFLHDRITDIRLMLCGFSFASVALLRLNMTALWIVMCLAVLIKQAAAKDWIPLVRFLAFFLAGVGVLIVPVAIWLIRGGAFSAFWYDYITFNRIYASSPQIGAVFSQKCSTFMKFLTKPAFLAAVIASVLLIRRRSTFFNAVWITYMFVLLALTSMSGKPYAHYGMVLVPAVSYPYALLIGTAAASLPKDRAPEGGGEPSSTEGGHTGTMRSRIPVLVLCLLLLCSFVLPDWIHLAGTYPGVFAHRHEEHRSPVALAVANLVSQYTEEDEPISVHGNWDYIYVLSHRRHSTLYSFQQPIGAVMPEIMDEYIRQLDEEMPPMIIVQAGLPKKRIRRFLKKHPYRLVWSQNGDSDLSGALVYVREDRL